MYSYNQFFQIFKLLEEVEAKKLFIRLAHKHHPDKGGDTETMQYLNSSYKDFLKSIREQEDTYQDDIDSDLIDKVNQLIRFNDLEIEILGSWIWITGNTKEHKEELKNLNFLFSAKKIAWYYRKEENKKRSFKSNFSLDDIRQRHGTQFEKRTVKLSKNSRK